MHIDAIKLSKSGKRVMINREIRIVITSGKGGKRMGRGWAVGTW